MKYYFIDDAILVVIYWRIHGFLSSDESNSVFHRYLIYDIFY